MPESGPLGRIDDAFEHRILDPLSKVLAGFSNLSEPPRSLLVLRGHVVAYHYQQKISLRFKGSCVSPWDERRICIQISSEVSPEEERLQV